LKTNEEDEEDGHHVDRDYHCPNANFSQPKIFDQFPSNLPMKQEVFPKVNFFNNCHFN